MEDDHHDQRHRSARQQLFAQKQQLDAARPKVSTAKFVSGSWPGRIQSPLEEAVPPAFTPKSFGNWVNAIVSAAPALKPSRIVSLMKLTSEAQIAAATPARTWRPRRAPSSAAMPPSAGVAFGHARDRGTDKHRDADVGPIASWRDEPNNA